MSNKYLETFLQLQESLRDQLRAAPTDEEAELINEDLVIVDDAIASINAESKKHDELMRIGKRAADSIRDMVAALECDYDRLEELRGDLVEGYTREQWADEYPEDAKELAELESQAGECESRDDAEQRIQEDALSVEMRGDWYGASGDGKDDPPTEFKILLSTGGPATQICGELRDGEPYRAWLEVQNWGTPWTDYYEEGLSDVLLAYARCFYFVEW